MTYIEIQTESDFGMTCTESIFFTEENRDVNTIVKNFRELNDLPNLNDLPFNMKADTIEEFKKFLKKEGFKQIKTKQVYIGS